MTEKFKIRRASFFLLLTIMALSLNGCWTPPNAHVQPTGEPRLIQSGVSAERSDVRATVQTVDASARALTLKLSDGTLVTCTVSPQVKNFDQIKAGEQVKVTLAEKLAIYVLKDGRLPGAGGTEEAIPVIAQGAGGGSQLSVADAAIPGRPDGGYESQPGRKVNGDAAGRLCSSAKRGSNGHSH